MGSSDVSKYIEKPNTSGASVLCGSTAEPKWHCEQLYRPRFNPAGAWGGGGGLKTRE